MTQASTDNRWSRGVIPSRRRNVRGVRCSLLPQSPCWDPGHRFISEASSFPTLDSIIMRYGYSKVTVAQLAEFNFISKNSTTENCKTHFHVLDGTISSDSIGMCRGNAQTLFYCLILMHSIILQKFLPDLVTFAAMSQSIATFPWKSIEHL